MTAPRLHTPVSLRILAIAGSLRAHSTNRAATEAAALLAPSGVELSLYGELADLPPFDPDREGHDLPDIVARLRSGVGAADALLLCVPEYAHGIPGVFKNALDWLVGSLEFPGKVIALVNTSPRAVHADAQLREVLVTMSAVISPGASLVLPLPNRSIDRDGILADPDLVATLRRVLAALAAEVATAQIPPNQLKPRSSQ